MKQYLQRWKKRNKLICPVLRGYTGFTGFTKQSVEVVPFYIMSVLT